MVLTWLFRLVWSLVRALLLRAAVRLAVLAFWMLALYIVQVALAMRALGKRERITLAVGATVALGAYTLLSAPYRPAEAGTVYLVSPSGDDSAAGSRTAPFRTITHCAAVAKAGDTCAIAAGTYRETVAPPTSGTAAEPITFAADGTDPVTVTGADPLSGPWTPAGGGIWTTILTLPAAGYAYTCTDNTTLCANQLFVDGQMMNEARWPASGHDLLHPTQRFTTAASPGYLPDAGLAAFPDNSLVGATVHVLANSSFIAQTGTVVTNTATGLGYTGGAFNCPGLCPLPGAGTSWYVTGAPSGALLVAPDQWVYTSTTHTLALWLADGSSPAAHQVEAKFRTYAFDLAGRSWITVTGLRITAATIRTDAASSHDLLAGLTVTYPSHYVTIAPAGTTVASSPYLSHLTDTGLIIAGTGETVSGTVVMSSTGNGIALVGASGAVITNTLVHDVDWAQTYNAPIRPSAGMTDTVISHNTLYNTSRDGINISGQGAPILRSRVSYNDISHVGLLQNDLGAIYICCTVQHVASRYDHNVLHTQSVFGALFYDDNDSYGVQADHNVLWGCTGGCFADMYSHGLTTGNPGTLFANNTAGSTTPTNSILSTVVGNGTGSEVSGNLTRRPVSLVGVPTKRSNVQTAGGPSEFVDEPGHDYRLVSTATDAIDKGVVLSGITDGFLGSAPDVGAYEFLTPGWPEQPGCTIAPACTPPTP